MVAQTEPEVIRTLRAYRAALEAKELALMQQMTERWLQVERSLDADMSLLAREMSDRAAQGRQVTEQMVWRMERYQKLHAQMEQEIQRFNEWAAGTTTTAQRSYAMLGIQAGQAGIMAQTSVYFDRLHINAIESMMGFAGDGTPLRKLLEKDYPDAVDGLLKALIQGVARGQGPLQTAQAMADGLGMGLERAILIARSETARAYRTGSTEQYRKSGVVEGYMRLVHKETACMACLMLDGQRFELADEMSDHPAGKCIEVPVVEGVNPPKWEKGEQWFRRLPADRQRKLLGDEKYEAWKDGKFELADLARMHHSETWGDSPRVATLKELLGSHKEIISEVSKKNTLISRTQAAEQIVDIHKKKGGSTFSLYYGDMAGKPFHSVSIFPDLSDTFKGKEIREERLIKFVEKYAELAENEKVAIGTWYDESEDTTYLDLVVLLKDRDIAMALAKKYNQIGFFDLGQMNYIESGGSGENLGNLPSLLERLKELP